MANDKLLSDEEFFEVLDDFAYSHSKEGESWATGDLYRPEDEKLQADCKKKIRDHITALTAKNAEQAAEIERLKNCDDLMWCEICDATTRFEFRQGDPLCTKCGKFS